MCADNSTFSLDIKFERLRSKIINNQSNSLENMLQFFSYFYTIK